MPSRLLPLARRAFRLAVLVPAAALAAGAQGVRVAGTVHDSVAAGPLSGAVVQLVPAGRPTARVRAATSDSLGRWTVDSIAPGRWLATFIHPRLDSLGAPAPEYLLTVGTAMDDVRLAIPGAARLIAAHCAGVAPDVGALVGRLRDASTGAPVAGGAIAGEWRELVVGRDGARWERAGSAAASGADGWFALCALPPGGDVLVRAARGADTLALPLAVPASGLVARDLHLGRVVVRLAGTVRTGAGQPLAGARVAVVGAGRGAVADSAGRWAIDHVSGGTRVLETRAIGYAPDRRVLDLVAEPPPPRLEIVLVSLQSILDTVRVTATPAEREMRRFAERRARLGVGRFMDSTEIRRASLLRPSHALERVPGVSIVPVTQPDGGVLHLVRNRGGSGMTDLCAPVVFVDGVRLPARDAREIDDFVDIQELVGLEVYQAGTAPMEFTTLDGCATVVIWTNRRGRK